MHYVNGGNNPPAVLRKEDGAWRVFRLGDGGPVVGLLADAVYKEQVLHLLPGDILLAFTDGISEASNASEDEWGEDRMIAEAQAHADLNVEELLQRLFRAADAFAAGDSECEIRPVDLRDHATRASNALSIGADHCVLQH